MWPAYWLRSHRAIGAWVVAAWLAEIILNLVTDPVSTTSRCATGLLV